MFASSCKRGITHSGHDTNKPTLGLQTDGQCGDAAAKVVYTDTQLKQVCNFLKMMQYEICRIVQIHTIKHVIMKVHWCNTLALWTLTDFFVV